MKKAVPVLRAFARARLLLVVIISCLIAASFTATALMKSKADSQAKVSGAGAQEQTKRHPSAEFWQDVAKVGIASPSGQAAPSGPQVALQARKFRTLTLNRDAMEQALKAAPLEFRATLQNATAPVVLALPAPDGGFQRFTVSESPVMEAGLAERHPDIKTYSGRGIDDPSATIRFDLTPLGFHASVRGQSAHWYIDPYYHLDQSIYISYFRRDLENQHGLFTDEIEDTAEALLESADETKQAKASYQRLSSVAPSTLLATGAQLRTYRLALITDPGYATFFGGSANVTPAKVTLINRVNQVYEEDMSIRMVLVANNDLLNLDTWDLAIGPNGPCGAAGCFTQSQVTGCASTTRARFVIGQIIGASNYDIGHLALGEPGGGVANLGVVGRSNKAGGCTGIPTPVGDFYAVDYVAHEMGHQFSGNHPFNGNQLNCSGGNRSAGNSVEPGSGSSVMAYAGICLTDDLQRHSDPYFSERSQQEIATYTASNQNAINEVQTGSLVHFGGGNEVQVATFGPGYAPAFAIRPATIAINAAPSATSRGGAEENGNTVTIATGNAHTIQVGETITIAGVGVAGYNGTWTVTAVPTSRSLQYTNPTAGLATSGGGTITPGEPGATESGTTATIRTSAVHNRSVGEAVTVSGVGVGGYNGTFTITAVPTTRTFQYTTVAGLANSAGGTATFNAPFQVRIGGNDSAVIGSVALPYNNANIQSAINAIPGFAGTVTVTGAASTGFTVTYGGASAGIDVPNIELVNLSCGGCFASIQETNHGGLNDSFKLNYNGNVSALITNGVNFTAAAIQAALTPILPAGATATVAGFGGGTFNNSGFQITFGGTLAMTNVPVLISMQDFSSGTSGFVNETDKGGAVDNKGGIITNTGNSIPIVTAPLQFTIPLRTPFALTGSATDADDDTLTYSWEQNDRGAAAGTSLLSNTKANGPLFAMFPKSGQISDADSLLYDSPGENHLTTDPARVFPDLQQVLDDNTNAATGACPAGPIALPVPVNANECFAEFLPTIDYVGFAGVNASPLSLHFRFTVRDGSGGVDSADTTLLLDNTAGPLRVTSQGSSVIYKGNSTQTIAWDVNNTAKPTLAPNVKISLSTDGGDTYPHVLAASTPNDGSELVTLPNVGTIKARIKVEAVGNVFFDVNHSDFTVEALPVVTNSLGGGSQSVQYSDSLSPDVTITATDADTLGSALDASASGLPAGLSLEIVSTTDDSTLPGSRTWKVAGTVTGAPGNYPVTVTVTDDTGGSGSTTFTIVVTREDADATYTGDMLAFTPSGGSSANVLLRATVRDSSLIPAFADTEPGDIRNATVTFKEGATTLCGPLTVALINGALTTGTASCTKSLGLGTHNIGVFVNGYYTGNTTGVVEVAQPDGSFVSGGGYLVIDSSGGTYKADPGSLTNFGFNVKYNGKNLKNLQGHANITFFAGGKTYQIRSTAIDSLGIALKNGGGGPCAGPPSSTCFGLADFRSKATLTDVTDPLNPITLGGNLALQITLTDKGEPGSSDLIGLTLWNGNTLLFSSQWSGSKTDEKRIDGGNLVVH